jgi:hypothetical protein
VPDKEHPASKAGRYVRAAGIVIGKEIDRRSTAAAAKPVPAAPPPPPPPPPPHATHNVTGKALFAYFVVAIVAMGLVIFRVTDALPSGTKTYGHLIFAGILLIEAGLLISNWGSANQRIGQRMLTKMWGPRGPANRRERFFARALKDVLTLVGIAFLAFGVFELLVGFFGYTP